MKISVGLVQIIDYYEVGNSCGNISVSMSVAISTAQFKINKLTIFETVETLPGEGRKQKLRKNTQKLCRKFNIYPRFVLTASAEKLDKKGDYCE